MSSAKNTTRKGPAPFKPPSRVSDASRSARTSTKAPGQGQGRQSRDSNGLPGFSSARSSLAPMARNTSLLDLDIELDDDDDENEETNTPQQNTAETTARETPTGPVHLEGGPPPIPLKLLARLIYEGFEDKNMKIGKEALTTTSKYIETFVREAMARAAQERKDSAEDGFGGDGFLQVEDLEKLAPQLLLDF
ncbi:hypothetical protein P152DRAFT_450007 [Eremomyces bilateralis CBS 781.70]|uniref:CENP-S complex, centromere protein X n=1 Tax=Eremomyces bilateralis CBS 781.70 TaxID=1392243 RepID=A0A6G1G104_9PEZI|nr:uncharacterized protein P152DRAFT_450007 [Eremomyces bilateralis CBS 781.70]KAF1811734.1 hypothetical protein P152DRAFT_450007 [Eremomyces bilateralis CBS 781.70]